MGVLILPSQSFSSNIWCSYVIKYTSLIYLVLKNRYLTVTLYKLFFDSMRYGFIITYLCCYICTNSEAVRH